MMSYAALYSQAITSAWKSPVMQQLRKRAMKSSVALSRSAGEDDTRRSVSSKVPRLDRGTSNVSMFFKETPGGKASTLVGNGLAPIVEKHIPSLNLQQIREAMESNEWMPAYLMVSFKAYDFDNTPWSQSYSVEGTQVRKLFFRIPLDFIPAAAHKIIPNLPQSAPSTNIIRLRATETEVVQSQQNFAHDAPFCNDFLISETVVFTSHQHVVCISKSTAKWCGWP